MLIKVAKMKIGLNALKSGRRMRKWVSTRRIGGKSKREQHVLVFFSNYTYVFQQPQLLHHCMFLYKHGAKPLLILFVGHFHLPLLFFHCCQYPI